MYEAGRSVTSGRRHGVVWPACGLYLERPRLARVLLRSGAVGPHDGVDGRVIGEITVGVSKSAVSRETVEASERVLKELMERRLESRTRSTCREGSD